MLHLRLLLCTLTLAAVSAAAAGPPPFLVGVGKGDITGPIAEVDMMGYAQPTQKAGGLHLRLFARAFIAADPAAPDKKVCFVSMDAGMPSAAIKIALTKKLSAKFPDKRYNERNVMISGTHTHSGPSGFFEYALFDLAGSMHVNATATAFVDGIFDAIVAADANLGPALISVAAGEVTDGNINRSPSSYLRNPAAERSRYAGDTDTQLVQLHFERPSSSPSPSPSSFALFNWFAVHPTSMNFTNHLISGDHKGTASQFVEQSNAASAVGPGQIELPGKESFVAAFASSNLGDVSPNTAGPMCQDGPGRGLPCDVNTSTCPMPDGAAPAATYCWALGPGKDMFESTQIIARKQAQTAEGLLSNASVPLSGAVGFAHSYVNMSSFELSNGEHTCPPGLGYSFAGGTTDGPGDAPFFQGYDKKNIPALWVAVRDLLAEVLCSRPPTAAELACHAPKPVLLPTGWMDRPWMWHPDIVDVQIFRIGSFVLAGVPGEFTTMSGRRLREALEAQLLSEGVAQPQVVVAGLTNLYTQYIATPEEYRAQRYEAASTIYGPNTLPAYVEAFKGLVPFLLNGSTAPPGPNPPDLLARGAIEGLAPPGKDEKPAGRHFGDVLAEANASYFVGRGHHDTEINVTFVGANPRQDLRRGETFLEVQHQNASGEWVTIANDASIATRFYWEKKLLLDGSAAHLTNEGETEAEWPRHFEAVVAAAERATGRRLSRSHVEACVAAAETTAHPCSFNDASLPSVRAAPTSKAWLYYSEVVVQWRPALQAAAAPAIENGMYRVRYHGDAMERAGHVEPFNGTSAPFRLVILP